MTFSLFYKNPSGKKIPSQESDWRGGGNAHSKIEKVFGQEGGGRRGRNAHSQTEEKEGGGRRGERDSKAKGKSQRHRIGEQKVRRGGGGPAETKGDRKGSPGQVSEPKPDRLETGIDPDTGGGFRCSATGAASFTAGAAANLTAIRHHGGKIRAGTGTGNRTTTAASAGEAQLVAVLASTGELPLSYRREHRRDPPRTGPAQSLEVRHRSQQRDATGERARF